MFSSFEAVYINNLQVMRGLYKYSDFMSYCMFLGIR